FLATLWRIIDQYQVMPGKGLPIGSLTSQHFANFFLDGLDRLVREQLPSRAFLRYMDDSIWWCEDKEIARQTLRQAQEYLAGERLLAVKKDAQINRSSHGVTFCGHRITKGAIRLTRRKRRRYAQKRQSWENAFRDGTINELQLQQGYAAVHAITAHMDSCGWRRGNLRRQLPPEV
ncbi:MAG: RNA-directed DNA polymerase, partial [Candidatus Electrothrix sp. AR3]|nr:RNA-directed DNA polymerase [Candidatus Electrothrix sp. AR3]